MGTQPRMPLPVRASDAERDRTVGALRDGTAEGYLSSDTFVHRVERAFRAQRRGELAELVSDLPPQKRVARRLIGAVAALSSFTVQLEAAWRGPRLPGFALPGMSGAPLTIGRDLSCDLVLSDSTVSRRHAEVRHQDGQWMLIDLDSKNGTRLNGWRQVGPVAVRPGDRITFGQVDYSVYAR